MPLQPPPAFVELMQRLGVATSAQILHAGRTIRRFSRELQQFDSLWVDALVRVRRLTPFQAREINAGCGEQLKIGPYLLCEKLAGPPYLLSYRAKQRESGATVRLAVQSRTGFQPVTSAHQENPSSTTNTRQVGSLSYDTGVHENRLFFAAPWVEGRTIAQWLNVSGRFSPEIVLEIARSMVAELSTLEKAGGCHGDVAPWNILLTSAGDSILLNPGLRAILRPEEGYAFAELLPEAYDYLAPERVIAGRPPDVSSDIYACGCVWWQMLCGRTPLGGGDSLAKLRAAQTADIPEVRRFAPETPAILAEAISACLEKEPGRRAKSFAKLTAMLGRPEKGSRQFMAQTIAANYRSNRLGDRHLRHQSRVRNWPVWLTVIVGCISVAMLLLGPTFHALMGKMNSTKSVARQRGVDKQSAQSGRTGFQPVNLSRQEDSTNEMKTRQVGNLSYKMRDRQVQPVGYSTTEKPPLPRHPAVADYLLDTNNPQSLEALSLQRGQRAIGRSGRRATILVPAGGLKLGGEEIRLENLDFLWDSKEKSADSATLILYSGSRAEFRGCRFFTAKGVSVRPAVLCWTDGKSGEPNIALPSGRMQFTSCIFHRVGASIDCRRRGAIALDAKNCLLLETSGLLLIDHQPELDEPISLNLTQLTMHTTGPLFYCRRRPSENPPGEIAIQAESCVFSPRKGDPLLGFEGAEPPDALLRNVRWTGLGSLVAAETSVSAWKSSADNWEALDDTTLSIAGLIRSPLEFAEGLKKGTETAENNENPAQSTHLLHWQAPLPTSDPPGVDAESLPKGEGGGRKAEESE